MRTLLFVSCLALAIPTSGQQTFGIGVGSGSGCHEVARQISRDWFNLKDVMGADQGTMRPKTSDFRCVDPDSLRGAMEKRAIGSSLQCFSMGGTVACCDAHMQECATL